MKTGRVIIALLAIAVVVLAALLIRQREKPVDIETEHAAAERSIRDASDVDWLKAAQAKDVERVLSFYTDEASVLPPNAAMVTGKEAIRAAWSQFVATPGFAINWKTTKVEVSRAADLAYQLATFEITVSDPKGKPVTDRGKWLAVWRKQPDGSWKVVIDIWNSDQPPPAATKP